MLFSLLSNQTAHCWNYFTIRIYVIRNSNAPDTLWSISGCCFGHGFHETHPSWPYHGEAITVGWEIWEGAEVLHSNTRWSRTLSGHPRKACAGKPTWRSFQDQGQWSLPFLLKASVTPQNFTWNCSDFIAQNFRKKGSGFSSIEKRHNLFRACRDLYNGKGSMIEIGDTIFFRLNIIQLCHCLHCKSKINSDNLFGLLLEQVFLTQYFHSWMIYFLFHVMLCGSSFLSLKEKKGSKRENVKERLHS